VQQDGRHLDPVSQLDLLRVDCSLMFVEDAQASACCETCAHPVTPSVDLQPGGDSAEWCTAAGRVAYLRRSIVALATIRVLSCDRVCTASAGTVDSNGAAAAKVPGCVLGVGV
jgi:hypothetical protein